MMGKLKRGFTLVELLVVISIIALLVSILLTALGKARFQAQRIFCMANIKSQHLIQIQFATDHDGKFAVHNEYSGPNLAQDHAHINSFPSLFSQVSPYVENPEIFGCPLLRKLGGAWSDAYWISNTSITGGWGAGLEENWVVVDGHRDVWSGYCWFANHKDFFNMSIVLEYDFSFAAPRDFNNSKIYVNEPAWPEKLADCKSDRAFIAHQIITSGSGIDERSHGVNSTWSDKVGTYLESMQSVENPVGYADGHIEIHSKDQLLPRAKNSRGQIYIY